jgi:hypothetical protein
MKIPNLVSEKMYFIGIPMSPETILTYIMLHDDFSEKEAERTYKRDKA